MENQKLFGQLISSQIPTINLDFELGTEKIIGKETISELRTRSRISSKHFKISHEERNGKHIVKITPLSGNGTWINGERIKEETEIHNFDEITMLDKKKYSESVTFVYYDREIVDKINEQCELLKKYTIGAFLGKGQFGVVREIIENETQIKYALKILEKPYFEILQKQPKTMKEKFEFTQKKKELKNFENTVIRECTTMEKVNHENAVRFKEKIDIKEYIFVVMELINGESLTTKLEKKELTKENSVDLIHQLIYLIHHLHSSEINIVHRDLKPDNIMIVAGNRLKLVDFGYGKELDETNKTATIVRTSYYGAPEMFQEGKYDGKKVDIWSSGVIVFELLVGKHPYKENVKDIRQLLQAFQDESYKKEEGFFGLKEEYKILLEGMMEKDPEKRFTAEDCVKLLKEMELKRECPVCDEVIECKRNLTN